jgi:hypothetical protein
MAYTERIDKNSKDSHQTSPAYVLTFTRWSNRDSLNYAFPSFNTRKPLVVVNDAVSIQVQTSKSNPNHMFSCMLKQGDLNYLTAIHPGDYVIVNLVNSPDKAMKIRERALQGKPINKFEDGFKGLFKINDVRMKLTTLPNGVKIYGVSVSARAFDEFNNNLYFNPAFSNEDQLSFLNNNFKNFRNLILSREKSNVQDLVKEIVKRTIGLGLKVLDNDGALLNKEPPFRIPSQVPSLLNKANGNGSDKKDPYIAKINNYYLGIWSSSATKAPGPKEGFNSFFEKWKEEGDNWFRTKGKKVLAGTRQISFENFANVKVWSLIKDYSNPTLNECYTCFRVAKDGYVYPSLIVRQKPYSNRKYEKDKDATDNTQFLDLPRWKISPDIIYDLDIGRTDSARINFVQVFTRSIAADQNLNAAAQIVAPNFVQDKEDIKRHGRKPYIVNCNYDYPLGTTNKKIKQKAREWSKLVADWVMNAHLKFNGSMTTVGIVKPICIGDNLEFDEVVYQIEGVNHVMQLNEQGVMSFRTSLSLSMGISERTTEKVPVYAEMDHTDSYKRRLDDYDYEKVLPGFSDTQDLPDRVKGEEVTETRQGTFTNPGKKNKGKKKDKNK